MPIGATCRRVGRKTSKSARNVAGNYIQQQQHPFNGPLAMTTRVSRYHEAKLDFTEASDSGCSGISWTTCKSAPHPRQIPTPAPHHSFITG